MVLPLKIKLFKKKLLQKSFVINTSLFTKQSMNGSILTLITLEEPQLLNKPKSLRISSSLFTRMDSWFLMSLNNHSAKLATDSFQIVSFKENAHTVGMKMLVEINVKEQPAESSSMPQNSSILSVKFASTSQKSARLSICSLIFQT